MMSRARFALIALHMLAWAPAYGQTAPNGPAPPARIEFLDVGQGDAILIRSPEGKSALVDAGPSEELVADLMRARGITSLDLLVLTHHPQDHHGGMDAVIRRFKPRLFLNNESTHTTPHYLRLIELVRDRDITTIAPTVQPRRVVLGSVVLVVLPRVTDPATGRDENDKSGGIRVQHGDVSILLPGDAEVAERGLWRHVVPELCGPATILKLAHHGSNSGTDEPWLRHVRPKLAIASVGARNDYGHPGAGTLALLGRYGVPLLRTDQHGSILVESDGRRWRVVDRQVDARGPPEKAEATPERGDGGRTAGSLVNVNTASTAELEALPGIGPVIARRIIESRPFRTVDELIRVDGIGPKRLEGIRGLVTAK